MNIPHYPGVGNRASLFAAQDTNPSKYLQPDYFLSSNNSYLGKKYNRVEHKISRIVSAGLLSALILTASADASASPNRTPNMQAPAFPYMQDHSIGHNHTESQYPDISGNILPSPVKKKSLMRRAAHKIAKRLGLSHGSLTPKTQSISGFDQSHSTNQPSISYDEVKAIYEAEYGESINESMDKRVERNEISADILKRTLAIRERELKKRAAANILESSNQHDSLPKTLEIFTDAESITSSSGISEMSSGDSNSGNRVDAADEHIVDTSSGYSSYAASSNNSDISSPDVASISESFDFNYPGNVPPSNDLDHTHTLQDDLSNISDISDTLITDSVDEALISSSDKYDNEHDLEVYDVTDYGSSKANSSFRSRDRFDNVNLAWNTEWEDSGDSDDDTSSMNSEVIDGVDYDTIYTSQREYSDTDSEYPNSNSEYDLSSEQENDSDSDNNSETEDFNSQHVSNKHVDLPLSQQSTKEEPLQLAALEAFEVVGEGRNVDTTTETQEQEAVTIDESDEIQVSEQVSEVQASIVQADMMYDQESEVSEPADPANYNTAVTMADSATELAISDTENELAISDTENDRDNLDLSNTDIGVVEDIAIEEEGDSAITEPYVPTTTQTTSISQETLLKKAESLSYMSHDELRMARKVASNHIKHRMFVRDMLVAVAAGDESESDQSQILGYSVWSSGAFGSAKQKASTNSNGYSTRLLGGSIGADINFENDILLGASFSKIRSNIKHTNQGTTKKLNTYIASLYGSSPIKENLTLGVIGSAGVSGKQRSKLLSLESHLNYQIALPREVTLIGFVRKGIKSAIKYRGNDI